MSERVDRFGAVASSVCAVHCAACALLPAAFGALGLGFLLGHAAEWVFTLVAVAFAAGAVTLGWRGHRSFLVAGLLLLGILGLLASRGLEMVTEHPELRSDRSHVMEEAAASRKADAAHQPDGSPVASPEHEDSHVAHADTPHLAATAVGVLAGLLLVFGHALNVRAVRQYREGSSS